MQWIEDNVVLSSSIIFPYCKKYVHKIRTMVADFQIMRCFAVIVHRWTCTFRVLRSRLSFRRCMFLRNANFCGLAAKMACVNGDDETDFVLISIRKSKWPRFLTGCACNQRQHLTSSKVIWIHCRGCWNVQIHNCSPNLYVLKTLSRHIVIIRHFWTSCR